VETNQTDLLIIGAGPGGYVAAIYAAKQGLKVTLVEKQYLGGTCLNVGCIPTKALLRGAHFVKTAEEAIDYGVSMQIQSLDYSKMIDKKDSIAKGLVEGIAYLMEKNGVTTLMGSATFLSNHEVEVKQGDLIQIIKAKHIIIATGSKTKHLNIPGLNLPGVVDSTGLLENRVLPKRLAVIGGGIIGMEFAFLYGMLGVEVNVLEFLPRILPLVDKDVSTRLIRYAKQNHVTITNNAGVVAIQSIGNELQINYLQNNVTKSIVCDMVLEAVGRVPNVEGLGLENTSIAHSSKGIAVDEQMTSNVEGIYAIGDVTGNIQLAHVASHQAMVAIDHILGKPSKMEYHNVPSVIFTSPEIATIGPSEDDLAKAQVDYAVLKIPFSANGKALIQNQAAGFIKLLVTPDKQTLLGATVFGDDAEQLIATITVMKQNNLSPLDIKHTVFAHPTTQELIHESALSMLSYPIHFMN